MTERFVETPIFTEGLLKTLTDDEYHSMQMALMLRPAMGAVIRGGGGLRKVRWGTSGRGKRGGARGIYYWADADSTIYLLLIYRKVDQDDLTPQQLKVLRRLVREELK